MSSRRNALELAAASFLFLFLELALIRWVTACAPITAYFSNIILIGCFLGFGIGCAIPRRRSLLPAAAVLLLVILGACRLLDGRTLGNPFSKSDFIFSAGGSMGWTFSLILLYVLIVALFTCIGQTIGRLMDSFKPLQGYAINVAGSLAGTVAFALCSYFQAVPTVWFAGISLLLLGMLREQRSAWMLSAGVLLAGLVLVQGQQRRAIWSPYYKIELARLPPVESGSFELKVNNDQHQLALNLSPPWVRQVDFYRHWSAIYQFPYAALGRPARQVLVLGAGTGNDVAAALRAGAASVHAVELDPAIYRIGQRLHPEHPYQDPRVVVHLNDARYFLRQDAGLYDLAVLGWLDSHRLFSTLSNVRQDNFVYTRDAFRQIRSHLTDDGVLVLSFYVARPWIARKLYDMLEQAFGHAPDVFNYPAGGYGEYGHLLVIGKNPQFRPPSIAGFQRLNATYQKLLPAPVPTDDWPYLYFRNKTLPLEYAIPLGLLLMASLAAIGWIIPRPIRSRPADVALLFLGAGFMLLETKNITQLALAFGSTWVTTSLAIIGVLLMILLSMWAVERGYAPSGTWTWLLLLGSLVLSALWQDQWVPAGALGRGIATALVLSLTFGLSNIVFVRIFSKVSSPSLGLGLNLLGTVVGGLTEYATLLVGIRQMYIVAIGFYLAAWVCWNRHYRSA